MKNRLLIKITSTLKGRLALLYLVSSGAIFLLFSIALSLLFWMTLERQIDHHVLIGVNEARSIVQDYRGSERDNLIKNLVSGQGMTVVVLSPDGAAELETNSPDVALSTEHQLQKILASTKLNEEKPVYFTEGNIRFAAMPVQVSSGKGIVAVGYSTQILHATFYRVLGIIFGVIIFIVLPITYLGYKFIKRQLSPLESIAQQAKEVTGTTSLSRRIRISSPTKELKIIQDALNAMLGKLEQIFKNEREFFADAAHTLKTPLAVIRSQVENIRTRDPAHLEILRVIDTANETIQDLLFLSQIGSSHLKLEHASLSKIMTDLSELATALGESKKITVLSNIQEDISLMADKKLLKRALSNIVYNAISYNKTKGKIILSLTKQSGRIAIRIEDTGIGIGRSDQSHVLTRFFRGSNIKSPGSGLGLAISHSAILSLGGKLTIKSSLNKGTTVLITFS